MEFDEGARSGDGGDRQTASQMLTEFLYPLQHEFSITQTLGATQETKRTQALEDSA